MNEELHYKTGKMGRVAQFFIVRRSSGDPYEETVVLPALIVTAALQLYDLKHFPDWVLFAVFIVADIGAGIWAGICLGYSKLLRIVLRSISVSILEAALVSAINDGLNRHETVKIAVTLMGVNIILFWIGHLIGSTFGEIALTTEKQWQIGVSRRAKMYNVYRIAFGAEKLEGAEDSIVIAVWFVKYVIPVLIAICLAWAVFGIAPQVYIRKLLGAAG